MLVCYISIVSSALTLAKDDWSHYTPALLFAVTYMLSAVMGIAVGIMLGWQLWSVAIGETAVEMHDHEVYRKMAKSRGEVTLPDGCLISSMLIAFPSDVCQFI